MSTWPRSPACNHGKRAESPGSWVSGIGGDQLSPWVVEKGLDLGNVTAKVLHTPSHTPESIRLLVTDKTSGPEPWFLLTGETLFVGAIGRPDLPGKTHESAAQLYYSLKDKILELPELLKSTRSLFGFCLRCGNERKADVYARFRESAELDPEPEPLCIRRKDNERDTSKTYGDGINASRQSGQCVSFVRIWFRAQIP